MNMPKRDCKTRLYAYLENVIDFDKPHLQIPWSEHPLLTSLSSTFERTALFHRWVDGYGVDGDTTNSYFIEVFAEWVSTVQPQDLELDFNSHQIMELLLEE